MSRGLAVVTGATAGIGREFCEQLARRGHDLLLVARDRARLAEASSALAGAHRVRAEAFPADLTRDDDVTRLAERLSASADLTLLVNNAGFGSRGRLAESDAGKQEAMVRLQTLAPMRLTRAALPVLLGARRGAIVNVSSIASFIYSAGQRELLRHQGVSQDVHRGAGGRAPRAAGSRPRRSVPDSPGRSSMAGSEPRWSAIRNSCG